MACARLESFGILTTDIADPQLSKESFKGFNYVTFNTVASLVYRHKFEIFICKIILSFARILGSRSNPYRSRTSSKTRTKIFRTRIERSGGRRRKQVKVMKYG
jgi:hypothetical protein